MQTGFRLINQAVRKFEGPLESDFISFRMRKFVRQTGKL